MKRRAVCRQALPVLTVFLLMGVTGCGWNRYSRTQVVVKFAGDNLLHMAMLPRTLPDGKPADRQRQALMDELKKVAAGHVLIENVKTGGLNGAPAHADLLLVEGPPELGFVLRNELQTEFDQLRPWVVSLPTQDIALVPIPDLEAPEQPKE